MIRHHAPLTRRKDKKARALNQQEPTLQVEGGGLHDIVGMQRIIGNRATLQRTGTIQRMPTRTRIVDTLGKPHKDIKIFGIGKSNSTKYKAVLEAVDDYHNFVNTTKAGNNRGEVLNLLGQVMTRMDAVMTACDAYQGDTDEKAQYFMRMKVMVQNDKTAAISAMVKYSNRVSTINPGIRAITTINGVLISVIPGDLDTNEGSFVKNVGGGINELAMYSSGGKDSYFKKNVNQINAPEDMDPSNPMTTATYTAQDAGIDVNDVRSANRDIASYRLDQLLSANVIARTQFAFRTIHGETKLGSLMEGAKGERAGDLGKTGRIVNTPNHQNNEISTQDPDLMRQLSKLQLLDALSGQIDRNEGNYFIKFDNTGKVQAVTAIDNDASWGTRKDVGGAFREYPGFSKYVDKDMADAITSIPNNLFQAILSDLLNQAEIDAFITRLNKVKQELAKNSTQILTPNQWDQAVQAGLLQEQKSFTARLGQAGWDGH